MKTLETERLILRPWTENDLSDFYEYASVEGVGEMAGWPHHRSIEESRRILNSFIEKDEYAIVSKEKGKVIGSLGIHNRTPEPSYKAEIQRDIGYVLGKPFWGQGLMTEAVKAAIKYAFEEIGADVLWCCHFSFNNRSRRVIEKSGFRFYSKGLYEAKTDRKDI